jgi:hypothetical protein
VKYATPKGFAQRERLGQSKERIVVRFETLSRIQVGRVRNRLRCVNESAGLDQRNRGTRLLIP